nr:reverse transcriptase domain-containing protein [Tanacetum cinerariifolium]
MNTTSRENASKSNDRIDKLADQISNLVDIFAKKVVTLAPVKVVEESCITCGGPHAHYNCDATNSNQPSVYVATGTYNQVAPQNRASNYMAPLGFAPNHASTSGTLLSNTILNPKGEMKAITTHSGVAYEDPSIPSPKKVVKRETEETTDKEQTHFQSLHTNKDKLFELAKIPLNENCLAMLLKKLLEKLGDPGKFLIPFVDFEADPRVPLILGRSFLRTGRALIDVYGEGITLRVNDEVVTFDLNQTTRYSSTYDDLLVNRIDVIDVAKEEHAQEILGFSNNSLGGNPTSTSEPILSNSSPFLTPFEGSDFILEEIEAYLNDESILPEIDHANCDPEGDTCLIEKLLNDDRFQLPPMDLKQGEVAKAKSLIEEPPSWVSPIYCVHKKGGITVVDNKNNELIPTRLVTGWRVCIDYRKLNDATRKDHFTLPFMDQMLERLAGNEFYCFLDGFFGNFQISINPPDQEKTTFTCPYGTFAYRRIPFGLCNAPGTFQRCMMAIFHDTIEKTMEVFMDDFLVFGDSFSSCLSHLDTMSQRLEVDRAKVDIIAKLPHPTTVKGVRSFLGHVSFYRIFIQDFSKIARPMTHLLEKETLFVFSKDCIDAFETLKMKLTEASILVVPDWNLPFELMCDASDFAIGAVLGQRKTKHF